MSHDIAAELALYKSDPGKLYGDRFFRRQTFSKDQYRAVGKYLAQRFEIQSACDIGCGIGTLLLGMQEAGVKTLTGVEYMFSNSKKYTDPAIFPCIRQGDAGKPLDVGNYDFVSSIEVAEHLPVENHVCFASNLAWASTKWILLTAAPEGQRGTGHIGGRPKEDWIGMLIPMHFVHDPKIALEVGKAIRKLCRFRWFSDNLMIFKHDGEEPR